MERLPCGLIWRMPNFCKDRKCETCPCKKEKKDKQKQTKQSTG